MNNKYVESLKKSLDVFEKNNILFDNIVKKLKDKIYNNGRIIFISTGNTGHSIELLIKSFEYLFKVPKDKFQIIISGEEYKEIDFYNQKEFENNKSIGTISAIEKNISKDDIVIGFSATGKTNYVNAFLKESKEKGAFTSLIISSENNINDSFVDQKITLSLEEKNIKGLYIGNHTTILKIAFELIIFNLFEEIGQIYDGNIMTTKIWTQKLKEVSIETIRKFNSKIEDDEIENLLKETNGELSLILIMIKLNIELKDAIKIASKNNYNFKKIFKN